MLVVVTTASMANSTIYNEPLDITSEKWIELLNDDPITTDKDMEILKTVYQNANHEMRASDIASKLNITHHGTINLQISRFSKKVITKTGVQPPLRKDGKPRWWHVPFLGYNDNDGRHFPWIMRPQLVTAFDKITPSDNTEIVYSDEMPLYEAHFHPEGSVTSVLVNRFERSKKARNECLSHYGTKCSVCGFDFEERYGALGKNKIHVHHIIPQSKIRQEYVIDPIRDLRPVCPNCHLIIHSKPEPFSIAEVKQMIKNATGK